jgi:hypothetical protein
MAELYTDQMSSGVAGISTNARQTSEQAKLKISVIDNNKIPYDESIKNVDRNLQNTIVATNDTLEDVKSEYQKRIDVQECRSDLFWRVTGISTSVSGGGGGGGAQPVQLTITCACTKLSPTYPSIANTGTGSPTTGFTTTGLMWYTGGVGVGTSAGPGITTIPMGDGPTLVSAGSAFDAYLEPDNLHGLLLYREPYDRDVFDTFVATGIGTISQGSTLLTVLTPNVNIGIKTGMVVTPSQLGVFASTQGNVVVGVSSTTTDLSPYSDVLSIGATTIYSVPLLTLQDPAIGNAVAPNSDGDYPYFDFLKDPALISDEYAIDPKDSPYVPQVVSLFTDDDYGQGVKIKYVDNGSPTASQEWNKFLEGFPDPEQLPDIVEVEPPNVGAGKIYYPVGFGQKPIMGVGVDAVEGDVRVFSSTLGFLLPAYEVLPTCDDTALNNSISDRNTAEAALSGSNSFPEKVTLVNEVRTKRNELNIAIWAYRTHIGDSETKVTGNDGFMNTVNNSPYKNLMNTGTE